MKKPRATRQRPPAAVPAASPPPWLFPIVGIGASAGGYEAFSHLLGAIPPDTGMAFVLIQHLDPSHPSMLTSMLAKSTDMPVREIEHGMRPAPDHVYVMPSGAAVGLADGAFTLVSRDHLTKPHLPIDSFLSALAAERAGQAVGVILSGTGSDGTAGLQAIKAEGGVTLVQEPRSAKFGGMPESALAAGTVDLRLAIPDIGAELARLARHSHLRRPVEGRAGPADDDDFQRILDILRKSVGVNLSEYKETSVRRRLGRRMALNRIETIAQYVPFLRERGGEERTLFEDILIHVTSFFRDPEAFDSLKTRVFPEILRHKQPGDSIRIWVTACSTGQEAYSVTIALLEFLGDADPGRRIQVFASDISDIAIATARAGVYGETIAGEMSPERLRRFFSKVDGGYRINKAVRDLCVFVRHDLAQDPAFSRLDLITCRNVLIYFKQTLQRRVLGTFHYSLNSPGMILLGRSENVLGLDEFFVPLDAPNKIFGRNRATGNERFAAKRATPARRHSTVQRRGPADPTPTQDAVSRHVDDLLLGAYAPPGVLINERMEVLEFRGHTGPYLEQPSGQPQLNLLNMARHDLRSDLRIAVARALHDATTVRREGVAVLANGGSRTCTLIVRPVLGLPEAAGRLFMVLFEDVPAVPRGGRARQPRTVPLRGSRVRVGKLEDELAATKEYLESIIGDHQQTNDALAAANEELASGNEELQSVNEELETAKEELQSSNQELTTLNDELHDRNGELGQLNSDLSNVINSVEIPLAMLDGQQRIRWVTPGAREVLNILPSDIGRSVEHIRPEVAVEHVHALVTEVMATGVMQELEVADRSGRWHRLQVRPYRAADNSIDGTVLSLIDIDLLRRAIGEAEWARDYAAAVVEAVASPLVVLDDALGVVSANQAFRQFFGVTDAQTVGHPLLQLEPLAVDAPNLKQELDRILVAADHIGKVSVHSTIAGRGERHLVLTVRPVRSPMRGVMILVSVDDATDRMEREEQLARMLRTAQMAELKAADANAAKDRFLAVVSHELRTPLSSLLLHVELLRRLPHADPAIARVAEGIERASHSQARLIDDLLDVSRISSGKLELDRKVVSLSGVLHDALDLVRPMATQKSITLDVALTEPLPPVFADAARLRQVFWNLLSNAIKFTPDHGRVSLTGEAYDGQARIQVRDTGIGFDAKLRRRLFRPFTQLHDGNARIHRGLGLGLAIVREVVELHGGSVDADSAGVDQGATFTVMLPPVLDTGSVLDGALAPVPMAAAACALDGLRILVVEDDAATREPLVSMLLQQGAEARGAGSAAQAMQVFAAFRPDILVSDIGMPDEDGYSLVRRIRQLSQADGGDTPALALTAFARAEDRRHAIDAGFDAHVTKPFPFERLAQTVFDLVRAGSTVRTERITQDAS